MTPGGVFTYLPQATDIGDADTAGPVTFVATLGAGVTALDVSQAGACTGDGPGPAPNIVGASVVTCVSAGPVSAHHAFEPVVAVAVSGGATGAVESSFAVFGGGASNTASTVDPTTVSSADPPFGVDAFDAQVSDAAGGPYTQAGGHPFEASTSIDFNTVENPVFDELVPGAGVGWPAEPTRDVTVDLPPGFIANPSATAKCTAGDLAGTGGITPRSGCPPTAQVGTALIRVNGVGGLNVVGPVAVYNIVPPPTAPARLGFNVLGTVVTLDGSLRSGPDYGLTANARNISQGLAVAGATVTLWGVPSDPSHDSERACTGVTGPFDPSAPGPSCPSSAPPVAFLRNPTACTDPGVGLRTGVRIDSWVHPGAFVASHTDSHLPPGYPSPPSDWGPPQGPTGCDKVPFTPTMTVAPEAGSRAGAPAGFAFDVNLPQTDDPNVIAEGDLRKAVVTLPEGVRIGAQGADGLQGCTPAQIDLYSTDDATCPDSAKVGSLTIKTPLLDEPVTGSVYLATPHDNPSGSLIGLYLVGKAAGAIVKIPGSVALDPSTGQITATFDNNPQVPFTNLHLQFQGGPRAPLVLPAQCGTYTTHSVLTSWSGATVTLDSPFTIDADSQGAPCPTGSQFAPGFSAGTVNPVSGAFSPFGLRLQRSDADGEFRALSSVSLPPGLLADVSSVTQRCTDAQAAAAACPAAAHIGTVTVGAGAGSNPLYVGGDVYLTTPYKGAPFGLAIVVHAVAGPFDLGYVVVRAAIQIHSDGSITTLTDPFPTILQGIPLQVRDVRVNIDRPNFTINPTSCNPFSIGATAQSTTGQSVSLSSRFQVGECRALAFHPAFAVSTSGHTSKAAGASLHVHLATGEGPGGGEANIAKVDVQLPVVLPARLPTLQKACTAAQFASDPAGCPAGSFVGTAIAHTPILASPLSGPAILVSHGGEAFPDLVLVLQGEGVRLNVTGHTQIKKGITFSHFETVPDAPVSSFDLTLPQGPYAVLTTDVPGRNLCATTRTVSVTRRVTRRIHGHRRKVLVRARRTVAAPLLMPTTITAQNGAVVNQTTKIAVTGCAKAKPRKTTKANTGKRAGS
jgi:hypothetical protein